ncbi:MAG: S9 family peptidase [Hyphomonadaceae bacterium]|nr:S9 family peptidase [Hyphomonadaceae bacterium]
MRFSVLCALAALAASPAAAQAPGAPLTAERIFASPDLAGPRPMELRFSPDGRAITSLRPKSSDGRALDLVIQDVGGGPVRVLIDADALSRDDAALSEAERARRERMRISQRGVVAYQWDAAGTHLLAPAGGDLHIADAATGAARQITATESDEIDARFSPGGAYIGFVRDGDLYVIDRKDGAERRITTDGGGAVANGLAEFVAQEELGRYAGYWFAPDDSHIAFTRTDESATPLVQRADINADGVIVTAQRYPRAGTANAAIELFVEDLRSRARVQVDLGPDRDIYLARADWSVRGDALYVQRLSRDQKRLDLLRVDPRTGASSLVLSERARHWVNVNDGFTALGDGGFLWLSARDGFAHVYRYDARGRLRARLTRGAWPVRDVIGVDEARGALYIQASLDSPLEQHVYRVPMAGGAPVRLTHTPGWWRAAWSSDFSAFIGVFSDVATPPQVGLYRADGARIRWIEENALTAAHPFAPYAARYPETQFGAIAAPGDSATRLHYRLDLPVGFSPDRRYPAIIDVYGGPGVQYVSRAWTSPRRRLYQERGYVVFSLENRGATNQGAAFEAALVGRLGDVEVRDQLAGLAHLRTLPFIDEARIGVTGWSYGGFMTLMLMTKAPEAFRAGVAGAPVTDWKLYDTAYTERYLGMPDAPGDAYALSSPIGAAAQIRAPLLIVHGMADDNVLFEHTTRFATALQQAGVRFDMMTYPGQRHGLYAPWAGRHALETTLDFFDRTLAPAR